MKPSEELRLGNAIHAALERVRAHVCHTGSAAQWHIAKAANLVRKPSLLDRLAPHLEGEPAKQYLAALPAWIEEAKQQDTTCALQWGQRQTSADSHVFVAERERLVAMLLRFDFSLRSYEKLARQPHKMTATTGADSPADGVDDSYDETSARMTAEEFADLERQIEKELQAVDKVRAELVAAHESLVAKWAEKSSEPIDESTSYARCGLVKAAENFDVKRGFRFATYAQWWIKTAIKEKKIWDA